MESCIHSLENRVSRHHVWGSIVTDPYVYAFCGLFLYVGPYIDWIYPTVSQWQCA